MERKINSFPVRAEHAHVVCKTDDDELAGDVTKRFDMGSPTRPRIIRLLLVYYIVMQTTPSLINQWEQLTTSNADEVNDSRIFSQEHHLVIIRNK